MAVAGHNIHRERAESMAVATHKIPQEQEQGAKLFPPLLLGDSLRGMPPDAHIINIG